MSANPRVVLITAGSAGLGKAAAKVFGTANYNVVINYASNDERASDTVKELEQLVPSVKFASIKADVGKQEEVKRLVKETVDLMGQLDVVFSNHGWTHLRGIGSLEDNMVEEDWDKCFNMNVKSHLWLIHAAMPHLEKTEGAFITTASLAGVAISGSSVAYSVTKAAQIHLMKHLANLAAPKIRVNTVSPGLLLTDWGMNFPEKTRDNHISQTKLKKIATVEDVAEQVLCFAKLCTVTGQNVVMDGGWSILGGK